MKFNWIEGFGWVGTLAILVAYGLNSLNIISSQTFIYQGLNIAGALGIIGISFHKKVYQSVFLNIVWLTIAIVALIRLFV